MQRPADNLAAHHTWLRRVARRITRSSASADDLVQDTCITALQNAPADAELRPWLSSVMRKLARGHVRTEIRRAQREEIFYQHVTSSAEPDLLVEYGVDRHRLAQALETLPEPFRSTVVQRFIEGRSCAEIARDEKVPAGTVRWRQTRALELLRTELEGQQRSGRRARRARVLWLLPALGIERVAASRGLFALSGQAKLVGLVLVGLAMTLGFHLLDDSRQDPSTRPDAAQSAAAGRQSARGSNRAWSAMQRAERARAERLLAAARTRSADGEHSDLSSLLSPGNAGDDERTGRRSRGHGFDDDGYPAARLLDDCWRDERGELRCLEPPMTATTPGRPTCDFINRNLAFIDTRSNQLMNVSHPNRFLKAALLANLALATSLGCQAHSDSPDGLGSPGGPSQIDDATCQTREGLHGGVCTTCVDAAGSETTMCAPSDCFVEAQPDGGLCTTCADQAGNSTIACSIPPEDPDQCIPYLDLHLRAWCSMCVNDGRLETYCQPAQCVPAAAGCLTCSDADGHSETVCSEQAEWCFYDIPEDDGNNFAMRRNCVGPDGTLHVTSHWPGENSCETWSDSDARCMGCTFDDGSRSQQTCYYDQNEELPDPLGNRPADLPARGTCATETSPGDFRSCTTCVREDGEATRTCDYAKSDMCMVYPVSEGLWCSQCTYPDGTFQEWCNVL